jgi:hypothetical protein
MPSGPIEPGAAHSRSAGVNGGLEIGDSVLPAFLGVMRVPLE